jgi:CheY-like chemotaxis protein
MKLSENHPGFKSLEEAENSMNRAIHLTRQLLTFARGGEPVKEDISLCELIRGVSAFDLSGSNVMPVFKRADNLWLTKADKGQIQQVFSNLIINADQAMPDGGHLYITLENADISKNEVPNLNPGKYVKATIRDEGTGIDQKHLDRIFDPYFSTKQSGSGLGLATVYSIVSKHGGYISVDSELGKGTTFTLYILASESQQLPEMKVSEAESSIPGQTARILVMDDEEIIRKVLKELLKQCGCTVDSAVDGKEMIEKYISAEKNGYPFDVVIMDLTIPGGMGGKEAIRKLLAIDPKAKVVVSSGYSTDPIIANYSEYGFIGRLVKPFIIKDLKKVLTRIMEIE